MPISGQNTSIYMTFVSTQNTIYAFQLLTLLFSTPWQNISYLN